MEWSAIFKSQFGSRYMCGRNSPGGPVDKTQCSQCRGPECDPWLGNRYPVPSLHQNRWGKMEKISNFIFSAPKSPWTVTVVMKLKDSCSLKEKL